MVPIVRIPLCNENYIIERLRSRLRWPDHKCWCPRPTSDSHRFRSRHPTSSWRCSKALRPSNRSQQVGPRDSSQPVHRWKRKIRDLHSG